MPIAELEMKQQPELEFGPGVDRSKHRGSEPGSERLMSPSTMLFMGSARLPYPWWRSS
jgi:hypothetical protein